jgi:uncharacterized protein (DUF362 family)
VTYAATVFVVVAEDACKGVTDCLGLAGLSAGDLAHSGDRVLLKPNLIHHRHPRDAAGWRYTLTDGRVIRAVADWVFTGTAGRARVIVADAPQTDASFEAISRLLGLDELRQYYQAQGLNFELLDLRREEWATRDGVVVDRRKLQGDPRGYVAFDLGEYSEFSGHNGSGRYYGADYDEGEVNRHHTGGHHEYLVSRTAIEADLFFNLPKLKTHKKAGITCALKNLVGINGDKNWLPHHTEPGWTEEGDERPYVDWKGRLERSAARQLRHLSLALPAAGTWVLRHARRTGRRVFGDTEEVIRSGNWWGNDTVWRMCLDLNKILLYGNPDGTLRPPKPEHRKPHWVLVDGILAGEGNGPLNPDPVVANVLIFGTNPASVDAACAVLMGFDPEKIPLVRQAFRCKHYPIADWDWRDVRLVSNKPEWNGPLPEIPYETTFHFRPHFGWVGQIERAPAAKCAYV